MIGIAGVSISCKRTCTIRIISKTLVWFGVESIKQNGIKVDIMSEPHYRLGSDPHQQHPPILPRRRANMPLLKSQSRWEEVRLACLKGDLDGLEHLVKQGMLQYSTKSTRFITIVKNMHETRQFLFYQCRGRRESDVWRWMVATYGCCQCCQCEYRKVFAQPVCGS